MLLLSGMAAASSAVDASTPAAWSLERAYTGNVGSVSMAVDDAGHVHIAAAAHTGLLYVTDRSGAWVARLLLRNPNDGYDTWDEPSIALDDAGNVTIAAVRGCFDCAPGDSDGIWYVTDKGRAPGSFGSKHRVAGIDAIAPSLKVHDGHLYLAYGTVSRPGPGHFPLWFKTNATGVWTRVRVARDGFDPSLRVDGAGHARIAYAGFDDIRYARATTRSGGFTIAVVPGSKGRSWGDPSLALDTAERPHIAWEGTAATLYASRSVSGWSAITKVGPWAPRLSLSVDGADVPHLALGKTDVLHVWRSGGTWYRETIAVDAEPLGSGVVIRATPLGVYVAFSRTTDARGVWVARS